MENNEIYEDALSLAELACKAKEKIRSLLASGKIKAADNLRLAIMRLGHYRRLEGCILEMFNEITFGMILDARVKKEELKND